MKNNRDINIYRNYVCPVCWSQLSKCNCKLFPYYLIHIDEHIQDHIRILVNKGYITSACCEGHYDPNIGIHPYIKFNYNYNFGLSTDPLPEGWTCDKHGIIRCKIYKDSKRKKYTEEEANKIKKEKLDQLLIWINNLPDHTKN